MSLGAKPAALTFHLLPGSQHARERASPAGAFAVPGDAKLQRALS